jgi:hypothetical protein
MVVMMMDAKGLGFSIRGPKSEDENITVFDVKGIYLCM